MKFCISEEANNSIDIKLQVNLLNNREQALKYFIAQHNPMTKLCHALFKNENEGEIG